MDFKRLPAQPPAGKFMTPLWRIEESHFQTTSKRRLPTYERKWRGGPRGGDKWFCLVRLDNMVLFRLRAYRRTRHEEARTDLGDPTTSILAVWANPSTHTWLEWAMLSLPKSRKTQGLSKMICKKGNRRGVAHRRTSGSGLARKRLRRHAQGNSKRTSKRETSMFLL